MVFVYIMLSKLPANYFLDRSKANRVELEDQEVTTSTCVTCEQYPAKQRTHCVITLGLSTKLQLVLMMLC